MFLSDLKKYLGMPELTFLEFYLNWADVVKKCEMKKKFSHMDPFTQEMKCKALILQPNYCS